MTVDWKTIATYAGIIAVSLVSGYFAGREHLKYEMRSAFQAATEQIRTGLGGSVDTPSANQEPKARPTPKSVSASPLTAALTNKGFQDTDFSAGVYEETITLEVAFTNATTNDIRAFDGVLEFSDLLDNVILSSKIAINDPVTAGATLEWKGALDFNRFIDSHQRFRNEDRTNIKMTFKPRKVLFADGTSKEYD